MPLIVSEGDLSIIGGNVGGGSTPVRSPSADATVRRYRHRVGSTPVVMARTVEEQLWQSAGMDSNVSFTRLSGASATITGSLTSINWSTNINAGLQVVSTSSGDTTLINIPGSLTPFVYLFGWIITEAFTANSAIEVDIVGTTTKIIGRSTVLAAQTGYVSFGTIIQLADIASTGAPYFRIQVKNSAGESRAVTSGELCCLMLKQ